jgi:hypothetical protein
MRAIAKKPFLLGTLAALLILALCAMPLLASSPAYANDKDSGGGRASSAGTKASSGNTKAAQGKNVPSVTVEINTENCFTATITPDDVAAGLDDQLFTLTYRNCGNSRDDSPRQVQFITTVPDCFDDIKIVGTNARSYDTTVAHWTAVWDEPNYQIVSTANNLETDALCGSGTPSKRGWLTVDFTADTPDCIGYLELEPDGGTTVCAGNPFDLEVTARECDGDKWNDYDGTVHFSSSDGEPYPADLPEDYIFKNCNPGDDHGDHEFDCGATLYTAGVQTITVEDSDEYCADFVFETSGKKQGKQWHNGCPGYYTYYIDGWDDQNDPDGGGPLPKEPTVTVCGPMCSDTEEFTVEPGCATRIDLTPDGGVTDPGVPFDVTVTLFDSWDNVATNYDGTVSFSSSDVLADLPGDYLFVPASDMGIHLFPNGVTLYIPGFQTVTATGTEYDFQCCPGCGGCGCGGCKEPPTCECQPPAPDEEIWEVTAPPEEPEEEQPLIEGAAPGLPVLVVDVQGTVARYPVTLDGRLLVDAMTTSPDGLVTLFIPSGCPVLNADSTPAYLNPDPDVFSIVAADLTAPAGSTLLAAYRLQPEGVIFSCDANIIVQYDPNKLPAGTTPVIAAYNAATGQWTDLETAGYVAGGVAVPNTVEANTSNAIYFAILAK